MKLKTNLLIILIFTWTLLITGCQTNGSPEELKKEAGAEEIEKGDNGEAFPDHEALQKVEKEIVLDRWEPLQLIIPAIELELQVLSDHHTYDQEEIGTEPWKFSSEDYNRWINKLMPLLDEGPVHYQFSALPGTENGNVVIAGHSPGPWYFFHDLDLLESGDDIILETGDYRFVYEVQWQEIVDKYDWSLLFDTDYPALTFQTCYPKDYAGYAIRKG